MIIMSYQSEDNATIAIVNVEHFSKKPPVQELLKTAIRGVVAEPTSQAGIMDLPEGRFKLGNPEDGMNLSHASLDKQDIERIVTNALGPSAKFVSYGMTPYSEEQVGFMGDHRSLVVTVQSENRATRDKHTFFVKSIPYHMEEQVKIIKECDLFHKEAKFYDQIVPELLKSVSDDSWLTKCLLTKNDSLVFEDLRIKGFAIKDKILDSTILMKSALSSLAKLHASSILTEKRLGKTLDKIFDPSIISECLFLRTGLCHKWFSNGLSVIVAIAQKMGLDCDGIPDLCERTLDVFTKSNGRKKVLCHGDVKSYNLMFDDSQPIPKCIMVDFQLVKYAPAVCDLLQLFYVNTRRKFRDEHEVDLLRHYHEVLSETLKMENSKIQVSSFSDLLQEYEELRFVGVVITGLYSPQCFMDDKMCSEMMRDPDSCAKFINGDKSDQVLELIQNNTFYRNLLEERVAEIAEQSKLSSDA